MKSAWSFSCYVIDGQKRQRVERSGFATKRAAEAAFRDLSKEVTNGEFGKSPDPDVPTLKEFVERYVKEGTAGNRPRSVARDEQALHWFMQHVSPMTPLSEVDQAMIDLYVSRRLQDKPLRGKRRKQTISEATMLRELSTVRRMFNTAIRWKLISMNPVTGTKKPKLPEGDVVFLEFEEQKALLKACNEIDEKSQNEIGDDSRHNSRSDTPYLRPLISVALYTGLRASEIFNLRWRDIDFSRNRLVVRNSPSFVTKSKRNRMLEIHPALARELTRWKSWFDHEIERAAARSTDSRLTPQLQAKARARLEVLQRCAPKNDRLVFPSFRNFDPVTAEPLPFDNIRKAFLRAAKEAGLKRKIGLHVLRHTFAVTLARNSVPLTKISSALGHSSLKTTEIYLRFMPDEGADVTSRIPEISYR